MLKSSHHPYQSTTFPHPARNPWVEKESSTNSSCGSRSGHAAKHTVLQPTEWLLPGSQTLSHFGPLLNQQVHPVVVPSQGPGSAMSAGQESSTVVSANGRIGSCGGQCVACETFCYYCLQVVFIAGILTGIALTIAGSVLRENQREGDLVVLLYIGVLLVLVCILLLSVHCCVRQNVKERKRALRMTLMESANRDLAGELPSVPVQEMAVPLENTYAETNLNNFEHQENPRPFLNIIPNPMPHYQSRAMVNRSGSTRVHSNDRYMHRLDVQDPQPYEWGRNPQTNVNRIIRKNHLNVA